MNRRQCPLCGWDALEEREPRRDALFVECPTCGRYLISEFLLTVPQAISAEDKRLWQYLPAHTRQATEAGRVAEISSENWRDLTRSHMNTPVATKLRKVLEYVSQRSRFPGDQIEINFGSTYPLFDAASEHEAAFLFKNLRERELLDAGQGTDVFVLSVAGWSFLEPSSAGIPGRCFVAMSFHDSLNEAYSKGIQPAVLSCGFDPVRIDLVHHNEKICDRILAEIRLAQFMVADFTLHRAGVYFEAGFAMGLGRPVIWTVRKDDLAKAHFDTRQYNHIEWEEPEDLRAKLADRIRATIVR